MYKGEYGFDIGDAALGQILATSEENNNLEKNTFI